MLGNIEEAIMANYKKAVENGNYEQAKKATVLATKLRELVEVHGFEDTKRLPDEHRLQKLGIVSNINYSHNIQDGTLRLYKQLINLTESENKLFTLFALNESTLEEIKIIRKHDIMAHVWPNKKVTQNAVRILIQRVRKKIEINPRSPELLINFNRKGYLFLGKAE